MLIKPVIWGTIIYAAVTFPLAVIWHIALFKGFYEEFGYFAGEPNFILGLMSILIQGCLMSLLYPMVSLSGTPVQRGLKFVAIIGPFFWTSHVLAFVARQAITNAPLFIVMETIYLAAQFGIFGVSLGLIYKASSVEQP